MPRYWCSFKLPPMKDDDHRPLEYPPPGLLGWWCSGVGFALDDKGEERECPSICVLIDSENRPKARKVIEKQWPEFKGLPWRFIEQKESNYIPGDRFPLPDWSPLKTAGDIDGETRA